MSGCEFVTAVPGAQRRPARRVPRLHVVIEPSRRLAWALAGMHALAAATLLVTSIAPVVQALSVSVLALSFIRHLRRHALLVDPGSIVALQVGDDGSCIGVRRDGQRIDGSIDGASYVTSWMIIVRLMPRGGRVATAVVLLPDAFEADSMRRLRVRLRWARRASSEQPGDFLSL